MQSDSLAQLTTILSKFAACRDWDQFHSPKNLSMALIAEAAELIEHFQWLTEEESRHLSNNKKVEVGYELADILIYLVRISDKLNIDIIKAANEKITINEQRYPAELVTGKAMRACEYKQD